MPHVAQAEAELRNARLHAERTRELLTQGFVSQAALDMAETQLKAAQAGAAAGAVGPLRRRRWRAASPP